MCPICSYNQFSVSIKGYKKCFKCETLFVINLPRVLKIQKDLEESSKGIVREQRNALLDNDYLERFNRFKKYLRKNSYILDFGCGGGFFVRYIISKGYKGQGFDKSRKLTNYLEKLNVPIYSRFDEIPNNYFDVITSFDVIEHTVNPHEFIRNIKSKLTKNGVIIITTPNAYGFSGRVLKDRWWVFGPGAHFILFSIKSLINLLNNEEFEVLKIRTDTITPWFTPSENFVFKILNKIVYLCLSPFKKRMFRLYLGDNIELIARKRN